MPIKRYPDSQKPDVQIRMTRRQMTYRHDAMLKVD